MRSRHFCPLRVILIASAFGCRPGPSDVASSNTATTTEATETASEATEDTETGGEDTESGSEETETGDLCEACEGATEIAEGFVECADGRVNRISAGTFDPTIAASACMGNEDIIECTTDADCNSGAYGKCIHDTTWVDVEEHTICSCAYSCSTDDDCVDGSVCVPPGVFWADPAEWSQCRPAACESNSDCGECGECGMGHTLTLGDCEHLYAIQCRTAGDTCTSSAGCKGGLCYPTPDGTWACDSVRCG
jgi:hypothetical protein